MAVRKAQDYYPDCPEPFLVSLARAGDRSAFEELVRRRQSQVRNLMRRFCNDPVRAPMSSTKSITSPNRPI